MKTNFMSGLLRIKFAKGGKYFSSLVEEFLPVDHLFLVLAFIAHCVAATSRVVFINEFCYDISPLPEERQSAVFLSLSENFAGRKFSF